MGDPEANREGVILMADSLSRFTEDRLLRELKAQGWRVRKTDSGYITTAPEMGKTVSWHTSVFKDQGRRSLVNFQQDLRRAGFDLLKRQRTIACLWAPTCDRKFASTMHRNRHIQMIHDGLSPSGMRITQPMPKAEPKKAVKVAEPVAATSSKEAQVIDLPLPAQPTETLPAAPDADADPWAVIEACVRGLHVVLSTQKLHLQLLEEGLNELKARSTGDDTSKAKLEELQRVLAEAVDLL